MNTSDQIDFVFDDIADYYGGIVKYGATILKVSSTVNWDLYVVGTSNDGTFWDNQMIYGAGTDPLATTSLPLELLELHQNQPNASFAGFTAAALGIQPDYSAAFQAASNTNTVTTPGQNNIYASATPYVLPTVNDKYIQGHNLVTDFNAGGSYLTAGAALSSNFYYAIDYRILPGLPAIFPTAQSNLIAGPALDLVTAAVAGTYAQPGVYTMNVKYVLLENQ